ncbi:MAG: hypothetical protein DMG06_21545 [Acidobacteria bacterium]|nr:MAG: hypothetical protein DMG06_21545 [Acidobacteriota bacterium]
MLERALGTGLISKREQPGVKMLSEVGADSSECVVKFCHQHYQYVLQAARKKTWLVSVARLIVVWAF